MSKKYDAADHETRNAVSEQGDLVINGGFEARNTFFGWEKSSGVF
ncbi:MAG TPA: hypothetical protein VN426_06405 [Syntrophomonadaceae bacterium]|nr:hypothetical protein [Syntrophomonadaceae bacterium]